MTVWWPDCKFSALLCDSFAANVTQMGWQEVKSSQRQRYLERETNFVISLQRSSTARLKWSTVKSLLQRKASISQTCTDPGYGPSDSQFLSSKSQFGSILATWGPTNKGNNSLQLSAFSGFVFRVKRSLSESVKRQRSPRSPLNAWITTITPPNQMWRG